MPNEAHDAYSPVYLVDLYLDSGHYRFATRTVIVRASGSLQAEFQGVHVGGAAVGTGFGEQPVGFGEGGFGGRP